MPAISMFYGIIIKMYNNGEHNPPHFHASYQGYYATFNLDGELIEGDMPKRQIKFIAAWTEIHQNELIANWDQLLMKNPYTKSNHYVKRSDHYDENASMGSHQRTTAKRLYADFNLCQRRKEAF